MQLSDLPLTEQLRDELRDEMQKRGYHTQNVFCHAPDYYPAPEGSKYDWIAEVVRWNTRSAKLVRMGIRHDGKKWVVSYYRQQSSRMHAHGE